jgi:uncharacterized protein
LRKCIYNKVVASIRFERDEAKNANKRKHGISFEQSIQVFRYPLHVSIFERVEDGEARWQTFGVVNGMMLVIVVAHTTEEDPEDESIEIVRIISARPAIRRARRIYENQNG